MENSKTYQFIPYPEEDIEIAFNLMAEMRADMWYWQKKEWYLKQKIKENVSNDFLFKFYTDLLTRVEKIVNKECIVKDAGITIFCCTSVASWMQRFAVYI